MLPSGETSTAVTAAQGTPLGGCPQSRTVLYGLGKSLMGATSFSEYSAELKIPTPAAMATGKTPNLFRCSMSDSPSPTGWEDYTTAAEWEDWGVTSPNRAKFPRA